MNWTLKFIFLNTSAVSEVVNIKRNVNNKILFIIIMVKQQNTLFWFILVCWISCSCLHYKKPVGSAYAADRLGTWGNIHRGFPCRAPTLLDDKLHFVWLNPFKTQEKKIGSVCSRSVRLVTHKASSIRRVADMLTNKLDLCFGESVNHCLL